LFGVFIFVSKDSYLGGSCDWDYFRSGVSFSGAAAAPLPHRRPCPGKGGNKKMFCTKFDDWFCQAVPVHLFGGTVSAVATACFAEQENIQRV
jgi:hypothetical protein